MSLRTQAACAASVEAETMAGIFGRVVAESERYESDPAYRAAQDADWKRRNDAAQAPMDKRRDAFLARLFGDEQ